MQVFIENYCRMAFILALLLSNMALRLPSPRTRSNPLFSKIKGKGGANERVSGTNIENRRVQRLNWDKMDPDTRVPIGGERFMMPGDFVVHEEFGIGRYVGVRMVDLTPAREVPTYQPSVIIQYRDAEISFFKRVVKDKLWLYRTSESGKQDLSTVLDTRKWRRRRSAAETNAKETGVNLVKIMAIRNGYHRTPCLALCDSEKFRQFERGFKFSPTDDQVACFKAIEADMSNNTRPMDRLVCGDVGFGKTEVAMRAIYRAVLSNRQVALLAPTRVLALQHLRVLQSRMPDVSVQLLRGGGLGIDVKKALLDGSCQVVVGTHALLQADVAFDNLGLLVIDEEQRFGVEQKEKLKVVSGGIDVLTLSATPIPRTLQMSLSGMRDFSLMMTPPKGRKEVIVKVSDIDNEVISAAVTKELQRQGQVFIVVPFVENVTTTHELLREILPNVVCEEAHGRHSDLEARIDRFGGLEAQVLIATTVVENGIDMPNVNTILVLDADRFGMSTLYQLRGRVGRSTRQAYAYFMTRKDKSLTRESEARLMYLETLTAMGSGYDLARRDMEMRGAGTVFGASQSGSRDVGLDFQSRILELALEEIKLDWVMPCVECRVSIGNRMETMWGRDLVGYSQPPSHDLNGVSRWEAIVAEKVIFKVMNVDPNAQRMDDGGKIAKEMTRNFLAVSSQADLNTVLKSWRADVFGGDGGEGVPSVLQELVKRSLLRMMCRRLGLFSVERLGPDVLLRSEGISSKIWKDELSAVVPADLRSRVEFIPPPDTVPNNRGLNGKKDGRYRQRESLLAPTTDHGGNVVLLDVFQSDGELGLKVEDMLAMPVEIVRLVTPLANLVDQKLAEEVRNLDKSKRKKGNKTTSPGE